MILYGATVVPVRGSYDDAFRLSLQYTAKRGGLNRNTAYHPLTIEGKKTVGLEIWQQNNWRVPDAILVPVGDGVIISGVHKAFCDLQAAGLISRLPRLVCVQAEKSNAIHHYVESGIYENAAHPDTIADSISVSIPSNAHMARKAILRKWRIFRHGQRRGNSRWPANTRCQDRCVRRTSEFRHGCGIEKIARIENYWGAKSKSSCSSPVTA